MTHNVIGASTALSQTQLTADDSVYLTPFGEALRFTDPSPGEAFLRGLKQQATGSDLAESVQPLSEASLAQSVLLLRKSRLPTRTLFHSGDNVLRDIRTALGGDFRMERPEIITNLLTGEPFRDSVQAKFRGSPLYFNTRVRHDLRRFLQGDGSYIDLSDRPVLLFERVQNDRIHIDELLGEKAESGETYQLLFALSVFGELRVTVRDRGIFHSSLFGPTVDLVAAGNIYLRDGEITEVDLGSGHFNLYFETTLKVVRGILQEMELPGSRSAIYDFRGLSREEEEEPVDMGNYLLEEKRGDYDARISLAYC